MRRFLHRHLLLPAFETVWKRRKTLRYWRELEESQWRSRAEIEAAQFVSLRRLMVHAFEACPYYWRTWEAAGLNPAFLTCMADFAKWPRLERETVREHRTEMRARIGGAPMRLISKATGGSSGVPLQFDLDEESHERRTAAWHRGYSWAGAAPGTKQLYLWGSGLGSTSGAARWKERAYRALHRQRLVSCFDAPPTPAGLAQRFVRELARFQPDAVVAYTNPLYEVARELDSGGWRVPVRPESIVLGAEKLHGFQRELIERTFGAPVFETYGSREFMLIGGECERRTGLHLTTEHLLVEVLDEQGRPAPRGVEGDIVITDLFNYGMPFVRYVTGDRAVAGFGTCACGRGLPTLSGVIGRRLDTIVTPDGGVIPGEFFPHLVKDFAAVRRFRVVQEEPGLVRFLLSEKGITPGDRAALEGAVRRALGPMVRVEFEAVDSIPLTASGKHQVVVSRVAHGAAPRREAA